MSVRGVELIDVEGVRWEGRLRALEPPTLEVLAPVARPSADAVGRLEVWVPLLKGGKTDDLVRQLTELGAAQITCFTATRSVARLEPAKAARRIGRWETIATEATRQCGRVHVPAIAFSSELPGAPEGVFFWEEEGETAASLMSRVVVDGALRVLIGPEGGLDEVDVSALRAAGWRAASLGPRVLRAETAVVTAAVLALGALGEAWYGA